MKSIVKTSRPLFARMHRALREFPRYNQFLNKANGLSISPPESHILVEVGGRDSLEFGELVVILGLEKTAVSKLVSRLCRQEVLVAIPSARDKRGRDLSLGKKGVPLLKRFDSLANQRLEQFDAISGFSARELKRLSATLDGLADALRAEQTVRRTDEHQLRPAIRRLTRAFQLLGRRALGSKLNTLEWQMLLTLCENSTATTPSELCRELEVSKSALAIGLAELERQQYVTRIQHPDDGRYFTLLPKRAGVDLVMSLEKAATERFSQYSTLTEGDVEIVEQWIRSAAYYYHIERRSLQLRRLKEDGELNQARREAVSGYLKSSPRELMPVSCFDEQNRCFGLYRGKRLLSAVELSGTRRMCIKNFFLADGISSETARAFLARAADSRMVEKIEVPSPLFADSLIPQRDVCSVLGRLFVEQL